MKSKLIVLTIVTVLTLSYSKYVLANEAYEHHMTDGTVMKDADMLKGQADETSTKAIEVGNKICPVSGEKIPAEGEKGEMGEAVKYEYNGKIYNLCCPMCVKDFKKNPEKYSKIAEDEVAKEKKMQEAQEDQKNTQK
ncbi:MAG: TRASH domain-containing protein [Candidatus Omnitrophica bacterium]|nr:TRASH domain-containing protein [Candidatus Omnitrophota bacterium]